MVDQNVWFHSKIGIDESPAQFDLFETLSIDEQCCEQPVGYIPVSRQRQDERLIEYEADTIGDPVSRFIPAS